MDEDCLGEVLKMVQFFKNEEEVAAYAKEIYERKFKTEYEAKHKGKFLAVDVQGERVYLAETPENARKLAVKTNPTGLFHVIQI